MNRMIKSTYRYLLYLLAVMMKFFIQYTPRPFALFLGRVGGELCFLLLYKEQKNTLHHLSIALGDNKENYYIAKSVFGNLGMNLVEWMQMPRINKKKMNKIIKITGLDRIDKALKNGKGVIVLSSHLGNWEYISAYLALNGYKGAVIARRIYYPRYDRLLVGLRSSVGVGTLWRNGSIRRMVEILKQNKLLGILPDQDTNKVEGIFVNFFKVPAYTPTGPVNLAMATGASIVPCFILREKDKHHIYVEEPLELTITNDETETIRINTERWSAITERYIRKYPEQWVWMHDRWKTKNQKSKIKNNDGTLPHGPIIFKFLICVFYFWFFIFNFSFAREMPVVTKVEEVKGFTMTIVDKGGKEKAAISGSVANILPNGLMEVLEVVARIYGPSLGESDTLIHTSKGIYNRLQNIITTDQFVRINRRNMVVTGTGLEWIPDKSRIKIEENVRVEYFSESAQIESAANTNSPQKRVTFITSRGSGLMDYQTDITVFKKNVEIQDKDAILNAHTMKMFFNEKTQELARVEAYGDVKIKQPKRESSSRKAVYYVDEDKILLTGKPMILQGLDFYTADKVTIYDKGGRVVFEPRAQLVIYASTEHEGMY